MKRFTPASRLFVTTVLALAVPQIVSPQAGANGFQSSDLLKLRSVTAVQLSPDGTRAAYVVDNNDGPGRPYGQLWVMTLADGKSVRFGADKESSGDPRVVARRPVDRVSRPRRRQERPRRRASRTAAARGCSRR